MIKSAFNVTTGGGLIDNVSFDGLNAHDLSLINITDLTLAGNNVIIQGITYPSSDGNSGEVLTTDGNGNLTFQALGSAPVTSVNTLTGVVVLDTDNIGEGISNLYYTDARFDTRFNAKTTSTLVEGTNLYYTDERVDANIAAKTTDDLTEGSTNLYYSESKFDSSLSGKSTSDLTEGTNLYYTDERVDERISQTPAASYIDDLLDVDTTTTTPDANDFFKWNGSEWVPSDLGGTTNTIPKYTSASTLSPSLITDTGTNVGVSQAIPIEKFTVSGGNIAIIDTSDRTMYVGEDTNSYIGMKWNVSSNKGDIISTHDGSPTPLEMFVGSIRALYANTSGAITFGNNISVPGTSIMNNHLTIDYSATGGDGTWDKSGILIKNNNATAAEAAIAFQTSAIGANYWIHGINQTSDYKWTYGSAFSDPNLKLTLTSAGNLIAAGLISEAGTYLSSKYLGINDPAANTILFNSLNSGQFIRSDVADTMNGKLTMSNNIEGTSTRSITNFDSFSTSAAAGHGFRFWGTNDSYAIWMSQSTDSTYGGRLDSISDYNMYFNMSSGTNRGFVFSYGKVPKVQIESTGILRTTGSIYEAGTVLSSKYLGISANAVSASSAAKWTTARTLSLAGDVTGSVSIDGSANVSLSTVATQAAKWTTARQLALAGDVTGAAFIDGSSAISITTTVANNSHTHTWSNITSEPSVTYTLTGDVTGSVSSTLGNAVTIATTIPGGVGGNYLTNDAVDNMVFVNNTAWAFEAGVGNTHGLMIENTNTTTAGTGAQLKLRGRTLDTAIAAIGTADNQGTLEFWVESNKGLSIDHTGAVESKDLTILTGGLTVDNGGITVNSGGIHFTTTTDEGIYFDDELAPDGFGAKRLTYNDGGGNLILGVGRYYDVNDKYAVTGDGAAWIRYDYEGSAGKIRLNVSSTTGTAGNTITARSIDIDYTTVIPSTTGVIDLGSSSLKWKNIHGTTLYEGETALSSKYLGISANATTASKWQTARTISLVGDLSGSTTIDGSANVSITAAVANNSHTHTGSTISSLDAGDTTTGTFPVARGGTGASSLTSNSVLTGNGTSAIQAESDLTYDGTKLETTTVYMQELVITDSSGTPKYKIVYNSTDDSLDTIKL